jgi:alanine-synthesizing transaminase
MLKAAHRTQRVESAIREINMLAKQVEKDRKIIYLNIGDPNRFDFDTPQHLKQAAIEAVRGKHNYYADSHGTKEAIDAIVSHNRNKWIETDDKSVLVTFGVSEAIFLAVAALVNPGENLVVPRPSYPVYSAYLNLFGCESNFYTLDEENGWDLDIDDIEKQINEKTQGIVSINPNNPTGAVFSRQKIKDLVNLAGQHNLPIISDEIYDEMLLEGEMHHAAALSGDVPVMTFNGLAKNFLSPGWRTGWIVFTDRGEKMQDVKNGLMKIARVRLCAVTAQQFAVKPALEMERVHRAETISKLKARRDLTYKRINEIEGLDLVKPRAAFYAFPRINFDVDDKDFVVNLLKEEGVAVVHGSGFDMPGHFRIVYLPPENVLNEAFDKIESFVGRVKR